MFIEYQYQKVIDLCGNFTIYTYTNGRWQNTYKEYYKIIEIQWNIRIYKIGQCRINKVPVCILNA